MRVPGTAWGLTKGSSVGRRRDAGGFVKSRLVTAVLLLAFLGSHGGAAAQTHTAGQIRAMEQRAADLLKARNRFLAQVLDAYGIPYLSDPNTGAIRQIRIQNTWRNIRQINIIPDTVVEDDYLVIRGHHIYFYPEDLPYPFHLLSDLRIRIPHQDAESPP